jgi:histone-lysine N-methyltransferase SETD7
MKTHRKPLRAVSARAGHTGEGLFARRALASGEVAAFYSGSRIHPDECDAREWSENDNVMSINEHTAVDVAPAWVSPSKYCASLGHKVNHSFTPNARFEPFSHPRFGQIKCVRATGAPTRPDVRWGFVVEYRR